MDADGLGGQAGEQEQHERHGHEVLAQALLVRAASREPPEERADERHHDADVQQREHCRPRGVTEASGTRDRDDEREDAPRRHVVDRRARDRHGAQLRVQQTALDQDAREHGERRDAHRGAHEQREGGEGHRRRRETRVEVESQDRAERERDDDARMADHDRGVAAPTQHLAVELEADEEHEQDEAHLAEHAEQRERVLRKDRPRRLGRRPAEQRRAEQDARGDLGDHHGLAHAAGEEADETRGADDEQRLDDEEGQLPVEEQPHCLRSTGGRATVGAMMAGVEASSSPT